MNRILVVDDEQLILDSIEFTFPRDQVIGCTSGKAAIDAFLETPPDVVLCDIRLPDLSGLELFEKLHRIDNRVPIVLMTGYGTAATAIEAMQRGAFEYVLKPLYPDSLVPVVESAIQTSLMCRTRAIVPNLSVQSDSQDGDLLVGSCAAMQDVYRAIGRVARQNVTVLILGESGTGKEIIARAIYQYSHRAQERFLAINCAAIPEQLLESELFGHERGAFTGAEQKRIGKFELCNQGTLFLDEIGEMTPLMQTKLLRVLQDQAFERVGGSETIRTDARIIAATNRNLEDAIKEGEFRRDLYYRLNVFTIELPALRDRGEDIDLLVQHFIAKYARELNKEVLDVAPAALELLRNYPWPGNVRELQSVIKHAILQATGPIIVPAFLPAMLQGPLRSGTQLLGQNTTGGLDFKELTRAQLSKGSHDIHRELVNIAEREIFTEVLKHTDNNLTEAANRLGITRTTLRAKLKLLGIQVERSVTIAQPISPDN